MSKEKDSSNEEEAVNTADNEVGNEVNTSEKEATEAKEPTLEDKYAELNDKYIRIHAEFDNYRKRSNKEKVEIISTASASLLKNLLPVIDDFERGIENNKNAEDLVSVKEGFELIYHKFKSILESQGLEPMNSEGEVFDVEMHEAIANVPAPSKKMKGKVIEAIEKGYLLNDKVIRFAKVLVGQ